MPLDATAPTHYGDFPLTAPEHYSAAQNASVYGSAIGGLAALLGHEINTTALGSTIFQASLAHFGDKKAIVAAIVANAAAIFPDDLTRPYWIKLLGMVG